MSYNRATGEAAYMLTQITISQFTVVDTLDVEFGSGMTVLTGETGAGKSIILDALGLCLGDRADTGMIRPGAERAELTAIFDLSAIPAARSWLAERDLESGDDDRECLLRRTLNREGRSRAYINGRPSTLEDCARLGELLIDIHGQHAHQSLLRRAFQRDLLDQFAGAADYRARVAELAEEWRDTKERLQALERAQHERADREELLRYQVGELEELALRSGETAELEYEQRRLSNADTIQREVAEAITASEHAERGARDALRALDPAMHATKAVGSIRDLLDSSAIQLAEARSELEHYLADCDSDPARLSEVEDRLDTIYTLARKHRVDADALPEHHEALVGELAELDSSDERLAGLREALADLEARYGEAAAELSAARRTGAQQLEKAVARLLGKLSMGNCRFRIALAPRPSEQPHPLGVEDIELQISTQPGAAPQPLTRVASGGELSRISLAIQVAAAAKTHVPCMVFDEVDVGIGGAVAEVVGRLLADMARKSQVLCVTHLPQVAAQGDRHLRIVKKGRGKDLASYLSLLGDDERVEEIARMLGGVKITDSTRAHAREMLAMAG
jgi:DNA repair protein RecN (Recombination protein N)